ncbi:sigma-70 family RNA polymerase sigma factor [Streptomyces sp. CBMA152]|uniref:sigma-70 family RNA polymerase sigma factor n=1 Tax=Streptomyces sp. CBMA152 TaxID=1896312 RepID=UPI001660EE25|nr:sigma-70 family RNA polymerase sigma factor [Streptomyces sp. CBMA152]MBD0741608.1 RNA polymerase subunit sigma-70 [Streptomyces sp. CBMA152]
MDDNESLAERFEENRPRLRAVAYRMLGSLSEAEDAVQEAWLRADSSSAGVENLNGWLTTVVSRVCLDMLRSRQSRREDPLDIHVPDPIVSRPDRIDPEHEALLADSVGLALLVVLDTLAPAERLAFVLHDMFGVPFEEIATIVDRTPAATRQLASRARRRVQGTAAPDPDLNRQRKVVDAFLTAARGGDFDALLATLDPDIVLRADYGRGSLTPNKTVLGAHAVVQNALSFKQYSQFAQLALVNGAMGVVNAPQGTAMAVLGFTVQDDRIVEINILADLERLRRVDISMLDA